MENALIKLSPNELEILAKHFHIDINQPIQQFLKELGGKIHKRGQMFTTLSVNQIAIDDNIVSAIKSLNPSFKPSGFVKDPAKRFPLHKLETVKSAIEQGLELPPIKVTFLGTHKELKRYVIEDGRHRFAIAVSQGETVIPVEII